MISQLLYEMSSDFVLGLANALAIDVKWQKPFECQSTTSEKFTIIDGTKIDVEMMHDVYKNNDYKYFETDNAKGIVLPYQKNSNGDNLEFIGILPNEDIDTYLNDFNNDSLNKIYDNVFLVTVNVEYSKTPTDTRKYNLQLQSVKIVK